MKRKSKVGLCLLLGLLIIAAVFLCPSASSQSNESQPASLLPIPQPSPGTFKTLTYSQFKAVQQLSIPGVKAAILVDQDTGQIIYGLQEQARLHPASITKLMTLYIILEKIHRGELNWHDPIPAPAKACGWEGTQIYLKQGEILPLKEMVQAMVVASANDAALAVAEKIAGSEEGFVQLMNEKAAELGLKDSHFINVSGLPAHNENDNLHYMSAHDIALLTRLLLIKFPEIIDFSQVPKTVIRNGQYVIHNTNKLLGSVAGLDGLKTGYTNRAGLCLVATAKKANTRLISVVLGAPTREVRDAGTTTLLAYGFNNYQRMTGLSLNGHQIKLSKPLWRVYGTILGPVEELAGALGAKIELASEQRLVVRKGETELILNPGSPQVVLNTQVSELPQPVLFMDGDVLVPLRFFSEALGAKVEWDEGQQVIDLVYP